MIMTATHGMRESRSLGRCPRFSDTVIDKSMASGNLRMISLMINLMINPHSEQIDQSRISHYVQY